MPRLAYLAGSVPCGQCWCVPGQICGTGWDHLMRYDRANRRGLISNQEFDRVRRISVVNGATRIVRHSDLINA